MRLAFAIALGVLLSGCAGDHAPERSPPAVLKPDSLLVGDWWGSDSESYLHLASGGICVRRQDADGVFRVGLYDQPSPGRLRLVFGDAPEVPEIWNYTVTDVHLTLKSSEGYSRQFLREALLDRQARLEDLLRREPPAEEVESLLRSMAGSSAARQRELACRLLFDEGFRRRRQEDRDRDCTNHLRVIHQALVRFKSKSGRYPVVLREIRRLDLISDERDLVCDCWGRDTGYVYVPPSAGDNTTADAIVAYDDTPHPDGRRNVLVFDGNVFPVEEQDFQRALPSLRLDR